jgi:D-arabinan exo alpha-(1,3)/(1,5)-arabinofuranosidase (non-reducing end)
VVWNPAAIDPTLDCRAVNFENPTGERGVGGTAAGGRKGAPSKLIVSGEMVILANLIGPCTVRHIWVTAIPMPPEALRALRLEVFYDGADEPSISVPLPDFFGITHGRPVPYASALQSCQEGRGFNSYLPMPFRDGIKVTLTNESTRPIILYYQIDYSLESQFDDNVGYLHATFRRENPTTLRKDFVISSSSGGPGRFLGCNVGIRVVDEGQWYGEGEVKFYRDGDREYPTICGTGLEDYVGSAWGMGPHAAPYGGAPLVLAAPGSPPDAQPDFVGFYRWHLHDPIMFTDELTVSIQQIGSMFFLDGQEDAMAAYEATHPVAGNGFMLNLAPGMLAFGLTERVDDYCATDFVYLKVPQRVQRFALPTATADITRLPYEEAHPMEHILGGTPE